MSNIACYIVITSGHDELTQPAGEPGVGFRNWAGRDNPTWPLPSYTSSSARFSKLPSVASDLTPPKMLR
jgi:hypothetical protein